jgi:hypothetical protein
MEPDDIQQPVVVEHTDKPVVEQVDNIQAELVAHILQPDDDVDDDNTQKVLLLQSRSTL